MSEDHDVPAEVPTDAPEHVVDPAGTPTPPPAVNPVRRVVQVRRLLRRSAGAALVLGLVAAVVVLGEEVPAAQPAEVALTEVPVGTTSASLVCPGPLRLPTEPEPGEDVAYDPQFDPALADSTSLLRVVARTGTAVAATALGAGTELTGSGGPVAAGLAVEDPATAAVVAAVPEGDDSPQAGGAVVARTEAGDLRGLASASCQRPSTEVWLVGGSTAVGSSARLVLQNPGRTAATVSVELWGAGGPVELAGAPQYLVPPGSERVVLLEGVAAEQRRIAVRLTATGGQVTGYLQDSSLRGLTPAGVDLVVAGRPPAARQLVPGLALPASEVGDVDVAELRLLAPGEEAVRADVTLLGADGPLELPGGQGVVLEPGVVVDLPLGGVPVGVYTVVVEADGPVVAGAMLSRSGEGTGPDGPPLDRAWLPSVRAGASATLALPHSSGTLAVGVAPGDEGDGAARVELQVVDEEGRELAPVTLSVPAGTTSTLGLASLVAGPDGNVADDAPRPVAVTLTTEDPRVAWAAVLRVDVVDGPLISALVPVPPQERASAVTVRVR